MTDFDFLESFIRENTVYETKEIDPDAIIEEIQEGDGRLFNMLIEITQLDGTIIIHLYISWTPGN